MATLQQEVHSAVSQQPEERIGNYVLGRTLGKGTFATVKEGVHTLTGEKVAVKILDKQKIEDEEDKQRILRELDILRRIRHPNIIQLYEVFESECLIYIIIEYAERGQLFKLITREQRLKEKPAGRIFLQLVNAVEYLHRLGISHRDLKPENILLDFDYNVKLIDFGLSNHFQKDGKLLDTACGSPCYAPPEMVSGKHYDGFISDVWSMGIIFYVMLCGYLPFEDKTTKQLYAKIIEGKYAPPEDISDEAKVVIEKMLVTDPLRRISLKDIRRLSFFEPLLTLEPVIIGIIVGYHPMPIDLELLQELKKLMENVDIKAAEEMIQANRHNEITTTYYLLQKKLLRQGGKTTIDLQLYLQNSVEFKKEYGHQNGAAQESEEQLKSARQKPETPRKTARDKSTESVLKYEKANKSLLKRKPNKMKKNTFFQHSQISPKINHFKITETTWSTKQYALRLYKSSSRDSNRKYKSIQRPSNLTDTRKIRKTERQNTQHPTTSSKDHKPRTPDRQMRSNELQRSKSKSKSNNKQNESMLNKTEVLKQQKPLAERIWDAYFRNSLHYRPEPQTTQRSNNNTGKKSPRLNVKQKQRMNLFQQNIKRLKEGFTRLPELDASAGKDRNNSSVEKLNTARK